MKLRNSRYRTLFFWLYAEPNALNPRLDQRVDQMLQVRTLPLAES
jgi:tRNA A37 N6-isopentenylltransferase MiaA